MARRQRAGAGAATTAAAALGAALLGAAPLPGEARGAADGPAPPARSLVLVTVDALRADHVGVDGGPVPTPALDALASAGIRLAEATTPLPSTGPAHASLLTGRNPWHHGAVKSHMAFDPRVPTVADVARAAGMPTPAYVTSRAMDRPCGYHQGFATFHFEPTEDATLRGRRERLAFARGDATVAAAMDWLTAHAGERFLLWVHLAEPQAPHLAPPGFAPPPDDPVDLAGRSAPGKLSAAELARRIRAYRGEVAFADAQLARLVERLRLLGLLESTALVVASDHGEALGEHGLLDHEVTLTEEVVRVPVLARAPGLAAGRRLEGAAQLEDLAPTMLALLGLDPPDALDGVSLLPWWRGDVAQSPRAFAVGRRRPLPRKPDLYYLRRHTEKWIGPASGPGERYDLAGDPREERPAAAPPPPELAAAIGDGGAEAGHSE